MEISSVSRRRERCHSKNSSEDEKSVLTESVDSCATDCSRDFSSSIGQHQKAPALSTVSAAPADERTLESSSPTSKKPSEHLQKEKKRKRHSRYSSSLSPHSSSTSSFPSSTLSEPFPPRDERESFSSQQHSPRTSQHSSSELDNHDHVRQREKYSPRHSLKRNTSHNLLSSSSSFSSSNLSTHLRTSSCERKSSREQRKKQHHPHSRRSIHSSPSNSSRSDSNRGRRRRRDTSSTIEERSNIKKERNSRSMERSSRRNRDERCSRRSMERSSSRKRGEERRSRKNTRSSMSSDEKSSRSNNERSKASNSKGRKRRKSETESDGSVMEKSNRSKDDDTLCTRQAEVNLDKEKLPADLSFSEEKKEPSSLSRPSLFSKDNKPINHIRSGLARLKALRREEDFMYADSAAEDIAAPSSLSYETAKDRESPPAKETTPHTGAAAHVIKNAAADAEQQQQEQQQHQQQQQTQQQFSSRRYVNEKADDIVAVEAFQRRSTTGKEDKEGVVAVGIGRGKEEAIGISVSSSKTKRVAFNSPEMNTAKSSDSSSQHLLLQQIQEEKEEKEKEEKDSVERGNDDDDGEKDKEEDDILLEEEEEEEEAAEVVRSMRALQKARQARWIRKGLDVKSIEERERAAAAQAAQEEEDDVAGYGLLEKSFSAVHNAAGITYDKHLEEFLRERMQLKEIAQQEEKEDKERQQEGNNVLPSTEELYRIPDHLQVADRSNDLREQLNWLTGLTEVPLPISAKLKNIEATEKAKRALLKKGETGETLDDEDDPDVVRRKAFGQRYTWFDPDRRQRARAGDEKAVQLFSQKGRRIQQMRGRVGIGFG